MKSGAEPPVARRLRCELAELVDAFDGEVIHITADVREELEAVYAELPEEQIDDEAYKGGICICH